MAVFEDAFFAGSGVVDAYRRAELEARRALIDFVSPCSTLYPIQCFTYCAATPNDRTNGGEGHDGGWKRRGERIQLSNSFSTLTNLSKQFARSLSQSASRFGNHIFRPFRNRASVMFTRCLASSSRAFVCRSVHRFTSQPTQVISKGSRRAMSFSVVSTESEHNRSALFSVGRV